MQRAPGEGLYSRSAGATPHSVVAFMLMDLGRIQVVPSSASSASSLSESAASVVLVFTGAEFALLVVAPLPVLAAVAVPVVVLGTMPVAAAEGALVLLEHSGKWRKCLRLHECLMRR